MALRGTRSSRGRNLRNSNSKRANSKKKPDVPIRPHARLARRGGKSIRTSRRAIESGSSEALDGGLNAEIVVKGDISTVTTSPERVQGSQDAPSSPHRKRIEWTNDEIASLKQGIARYGIGEWKAMLDDTRMSFNSARKPGDLRSKQVSLANRPHGKDIVSNIFAEGFRILSISEIGRQPTPPGSITTSEYLVYRLHTNFSTHLTAWTTAQSHHPDWEVVVKDYCDNPNVPEVLKRALSQSVPWNHERQAIFIPNPKDPLFAPIRSQQRQFAQEPAQHVASEDEILETRLPSRDPMPKSHPQHFIAEPAMNLSPEVVINDQAAGHSTSREILIGVLSRHRRFM